MAKISIRSDDVDMLEGVVIGMQFASSRISIATKTFRRDLFNMLPYEVVLEDTGNGCDKYLTLCNRKIVKVTKEDYNQL